jgi:sterol desaturase/sphingolipid hydroxylase (fatty acid hydroxylase superfamily)
MIVPAIVLAVAIVMIAVELAAPGRRWPAVAGWWTRAVALNSVQAGIAFLAGTTWDGWMERHRFFSAEALGTTGGAITGYLVITFVYYWWHRARHESDLLWRWLHQLHHSPRRIEIVTSFYKHPLEILVNGVLSSAVVYLVVGLDRAAATQAVMLTGLAELFYHWNVRTPHWLGYVIQRPESHCVHHEEGLHSFNFADLPLWDMAFGTFRNPRRWEAACGLGAEGETRLLDLLRGVDVIRTPAR